LGKCHDKGDYDGAFEYHTKAAELGDSIAHFLLGYMYGEGEGVEKDEEKAVYHFEKTAIGGHPFARHNLGSIERKHGRMERAVKHFIIAAKLGCDDSMKVLWGQYSEGNITKEDLDATLRTHQAAIDETKSEQRDF
jgi:TPR repeat protein